VTIEFATAFKLTLCFIPVRSGQTNLRLQGVRDDLQRDTIAVVDRLSSTENSDWL
jgi:hypothetical protein